MYQVHGKTDTTKFINILLTKFIYNSFNNKFSFNKIQTDTDT